MSDRWLLLIYTVPAHPSRKRAAVWREVKKAGAVYLRDGVCILPDQPHHLTAFQDIAARVEGLGGRATLVQSAALDSERSDAVIAESSSARGAEYDDILREAGRFRSHLQVEQLHRDFASSELQQLEADLEKLQRWASQVRARDFAGLDKASAVEAALALCSADLTSLAEELYEREERDL